MKTQINLIKQLREAANSLEKDLKKDLANFDASLLREFEWRLGLGVNSVNQLCLNSSTPKTEKGREFIATLPTSIAPLPAVANRFYKTISIHLGDPLNSSIGFGFGGDGDGNGYIYFNAPASTFNDLIAKIGPLDITNIKESLPKVQEKRDAAEKRVCQWDDVIVYLNR